MVQLIFFIPQFQDFVANFHKNCKNVLKMFSMFDKFFRVSVSLLQGALETDQSRRDEVFSKNMADVCYFR